nr:hypothetical protein [Flavobacterium sp. LM5]
MLTPLPYEEPEEEQPEETKLDIDPVDDGAIQLEDDGQVTLSLE